MMNRFFKTSFFLFFCLHISCLVVANEKGRNTSKRISGLGWFNNPSPGNAFFIDKEDTWVVESAEKAGGRGIQWPEFGLKTSDYWVYTNAASYGYGCVSSEGLIVDKTTKNILKLSSNFEVKPLQECRSNSSIETKEPRLPDESKSKPISSI